MDLSLIIKIKISKYNKKNDLNWDWVQSPIPILKELIIIGLYNLFYQI